MPNCPPRPERTLPREIRPRRPSGVVTRARQIARTLTYARGHTLFSIVGSRCWLKNELQEDGVGNGENAGNEWLEPMQRFKQSTLSVGPHQIRPNGHAQLQKRCLAHENHLHEREDQTDHEDSA